MMYVREGMRALLVIVWHERAGQGTAVTSFKWNMKLRQSLLLLKFNYRGNVFKLACCTNPVSQTTIIRDYTDVQPLELS